ncbi:MAG TPA: transporter substrate-binding domain-containing protein [Hyphomicrobium sp.]|nr:transporter substrate-binding domain-containing protein [Hyphomicrobium sp.]
MLDRRQTLVLGASAVAFAFMPAHVRAAAKVRLTSVKYGTVSWLIETIKLYGLDKKNGLDLKVVEVANNQAGPVALLAGEADVIVTDWTWALRLRSKGNDLKFSPYSSALGSLLVPKDSPIRTLADLQGKRIGVAGTSIDKSWVLLRAYAMKSLGKDLEKNCQPVYGAAPLITEEFRNGRLDACLNFWTYAARLTSEGARQLLTVDDIIKALEVSPIPPLVGFVWSQQAIQSNGVSIEPLLAAVADANKVLATSDEAWDRIKPLVRPANDAEFIALRDYFRSGVPGPWTQAETQAAGKLTQLLIELGDAELVGDGTRFDPNLFHTPTG